MYVSVDMLNAVKSMLGDVSSVSPSEQKKKPKIRCIQIKKIY